MRPSRAYLPRIHQGLPLALAALTACSAANRDGSTSTGSGNLPGVTPNGSNANGLDPSSPPGPGATPASPASTDAGPTPTPSITPVVVGEINECGTDNPAGLSDADVQTLKAGGGTGGRWLYPYEGTVFPRGMRSPTLMWEEGAADAVYVKLVSGGFLYEGCLRPSADGRVDIPQHAWDAAGVRTTGAADPYTLEVTSLSGGTARGPITRQIVIAPATIQGSIYYNSYTSQLAPASFGGESGGAVLRIPQGGDAEIFTGGGDDCQGCHSVSANGTRLLTDNDARGLSYMLTPGGTTNPPAMNAGQRGCFGALYPEGSVYLSTTGPVATCVEEGSPSALYYTDTGQAAAGQGIPNRAAMPMFSPDGTLLVYNDFGAGAGNSTLAMMDFDGTTLTASGRRVLYQDSGGMRPGWPFVLPDNEGVVFVRTTSEQFSGESAGISSEPPDPGFGFPFPGGGGGSAGGRGPSSDLYMVDVASGQVTMLAQAMGFETAQAANSEQTYLPFGADDLHQNYYPTVSPVASGGYFWVFFDSIRNYGNMGLVRQLWGAAIAVSADGDYTVDRSHPAFYVSGQEFGTGNHRAFTALDPCKADGESCTSGADCCGGNCILDEFGFGVCGYPPERTCSDTGNACSVSSDCCDPTESCINGFCSTVLIQ